MIDNSPYAGLAAYFDHAVWRDSERYRRIANLLVDQRWPWIPWWASLSGLHKRDDRSSVRVGGKNGATPLIDGFSSPNLTRLYMNRAKGDDNFTSVMLDLGRMGEDWGWEAPFCLWVTCRCSELPPGKSTAEWLTLAHDLVSAVGALHATLGVWPTYNMAIGDTWLTRIVLDTPEQNYNLGLPDNFRDQIGAIASWKKVLGRTYARHPRWGTYLNPAHVTAVGGVERIRTEVEPARIDAVGQLTYIQLTDSVETALTPLAGERRRRLESLMAPIILGAGRV